MVQIWLLIGMLTFLNLIGVIVAFSNSSGSYLDTIFIGYFLSNLLRELSYIPLILLSQAQHQLAQIFFGIYFLFVILSYLTIFMFIELSNSTNFFKETLFYFFSCAFLFGFYFTEHNSLHFGWYLEYEHWMQDFSLLFIIIFCAFLFFSLVIFGKVIYQFLQQAPKFTQREKIWKVIAILAIFIKLGSMSISIFSHRNLPEIGETIGASMILMVFIFEPKTFLSTKIHISEFHIINGSSGLSYFTLGGSSNSSNLLFATSSIQKEILHLTQFPQEIIFEEKKIILYSIAVADQKIIGVLISNINTFGLKKSLEQSTKAFCQIFKKEIMENQGDLTHFGKFEKNLYKIFYFAEFIHKSNNLPSDNEGSNH